MRIHRIREQHLVDGEAEHRARHLAHIGKLRRYGHEAQIRDSRMTLVPYIDSGRWVADCVERMPQSGSPCRAGIAADPEMGVALCFGCGAVYTRLSWPVGAQQAETILMRRPDPNLRNFHPGETVAGLQAENVVLGIKERD